MDSTFSTVAAFVAGFVAFSAWMTLIIGSIAAWVTHVIVCIKASAWVLLAFGCVIAPVGVIHGVGVWLGAF